ncbi:MAG: hypothetical protein PHY86_03395 [Candidatus Gracilibacteria bacterium]|nr:hypothetical protein [Candidatus Gracilibacteria bacterium]
MKSNLINNFFRKDLNLKNRWWHRLLFVVFITTFTSLVIVNAYDILGDGKFQQWKKVDALKERITSEIKPISALIKVGEKIGEDNADYALNYGSDEYYNGILNDVYCSTELSNNYEKIKNDRNINSLYIRNLYDRNNVSPDIFSNYIKQNDIRCLTVDAYTTYDTSGQVSEKLTFLEPDKSYQDNWSFYEKSPIKTIMYIVEMLAIILSISFLVFAGIIVIYYKVFIYIIFGSKKNI